jgi:hypothetical protein
MSDDTLKPVERAALLLLVAVATPEVANPDLNDRFGVTITGDGWRGLNERKLVKTEKRGRSLTHEVTDDGWARAREELTGLLPKSVLGQAAVAAITEQLHRYLARADVALSEVFAAPTEAEKAPADEDVPAAVPQANSDLETRIRAAYRSLAPEPNAWVLLTDLRPLLDDVSKAEFDAALVELNRAPDVTLTPETNKKSLSAADKAAAVEIGRQKKHLIAIEGA